MDFLKLPERAAKPRSKGITHVLDKGLGPAQIADLVAVAGPYIDIVKLGWGTAYVTAGLAQKIELYASHGIPVCFGGTMLEVALRQNKLDEYLAVVRRYGIQHVEVSDGTIALTGEGRVQGAQLKVCTCVFDPEGRFHPEYDETQHKSLECDVVIVAAGMGADTETFGLETNGNRTLKADSGTLQTPVPRIFAAGDVVSGPTMITTAVGQGRRAAFMIDRYLQGAELAPAAFDEGLPVVDKTDVLGRQDVYDRREPLEPSAVMSATPSDFGETEGPMTEDEAFLGAARCLDCGVCSECHACVDACPADAIKPDTDVAREPRHAGFR